MICTSCQDIEDLEIEYPDEPHHGGIRYCGECNAEYWEEYGGRRSNMNEQAILNHPNLPKI